MKKLLYIAVLALCTSTAYGQMADKGKWEILLSGLAFEQQDGLIFSGAVQPQFANAVVINAPLRSSRNYIRIQARRIDWTTDIAHYEGHENSAQSGFAAGLGFERRWFTSQRFWIHAGGDLLFQQTHVTGQFEEDPDMMLSVIDHTKKNFSISPLLGLNFQITKWLYARIETGANLGVTTIISHTDELITASDVYSDASLKPVSILGFAFRI